MPPWRGGGGKTVDEPLRMTLKGLELSREGTDLIDELIRKHRLERLDTVQIEIDIKGITSKEAPLYTERLNLYKDGTTQPLAFERSFATSAGAPARRALLDALATVAPEDSEVYLVLHALAPASAARGQTSRSKGERDEELRFELGEIR